MLRETKIIILTIFKIEDPEKVGNTIKYWLLHLACQASGIASLWLADFLSDGGATWKETLYRGIFGGAVGSVFLHVKTPRVKDQVEQAQTVTVLESHDEAQ